MRRQTTKDIELSGRKWRLAKVDPITGTFLASKLISRVAHLGVAIMAGVKDPVVIFQAVSEAMGSYSKAELFDIINEALSVVSEVQLVEVTGAEGSVPVKRADGSWNPAVEGLNEDLLTVIALTAHSLIFSVIEPFFDQDTVKATVSSFQGFDLSTVLASMNGPTDQ